MSRDFEQHVRACYSTWGRRYFDEYYASAAYPPVHAARVRMLLAEASAQTVLDAGCGPASFLRTLFDDGYDLFGFDLTPEMVDEARAVFAARGLRPERIWQGSVLDQAAYRQPDGSYAAFDAAVCIGVLPHIPAESDEHVLRNLRDSVRDGGLVIVEARNQLFGLFTFNRYSYELVTRDLARVPALLERAGEEADALQAALDRLQDRFSMDTPPVREGDAGVPGYDEVLSRLHNPLILRDQFAAAGFENVQVLYYHFHALPPQLEEAIPELFRRESLALEDDPADWRGMFMASAFIVAGRRA